MPNGRYIFTDSDGPPIRGFASTQMSNAPSIYVKLEGTCELARRASLPRGPRDRPGTNSVRECSVVVASILMRNPIIWALLLLVAWGSPDHGLAQETLFTERIAPLLERHCLRCHEGADSESGLALNGADWLTDREWVIPGAPDQSRLLALVTPQGGQARMPQDAPPLSAGEIGDLRKWIQEGARWPDGQVLESQPVRDFSGWAYQPLKTPPIPGPVLGDAPHPIDRFIRQQLNQRGLQPSRIADRRTLIRRLCYDLTGLPPTPKEVREFVGDDAPDAYLRLVDRLLGSPRYGEHWARHWLDVVKYADTCGYDKDKLRPDAWPYRDYVIRSLNEDKPYARFIQEQVAGDVLFPDEPDGVLGLGMIAAGPWDFIGHVEVPETKIDGKVARNLDRDDMVSNVFNTFCSLTVQCARCHHHKFDPIEQADYYRLQAIFAAVDRAPRSYDLDPADAQARRRWQEELEEAESGLAEIEAALNRAGGAELERLNREIEESNSSPVQQTAAFGYHSQIAQQGDQEKWVGVVFESPEAIAKAILRPCYDEFNSIGAGFGFPKKFRLEVRDSKGQWKALAGAAEVNPPNPGLEAMEWKVDAQGITGLRVVATRLANRRNDFHLALAEMELLDDQGSNIAPRGTVVALDSIEAPPRWQKTHLIDGHWPRFSMAADGPSREEMDAVRAALIAKLTTPEMATRRRSLVEQRQRAKGHLESLPPQSKVYAAATAFSPQGNFQSTGGQPRPIFLLKRGDVKSPGEPLGPALLPLADGDETVLPVDLSEGERRAALARWLIDPQNPFVWRSIVNRVWQYHFGRGLVSTPNDFGKMGAIPSHPELLDWLACQFRDSGQSLKDLHRLIVTSETYRQVSDHDPDNARLDSGNQYLWRMPRRRLTAEEMRDSILAVSGQLDLTMGGPGYYLFQIDKPEHSPHFEYHRFDPADRKTHRRSIYRFVVRSQPDPWMSTLDCADSSQSTPRRNETLTPLQALSLMNSRFNLVMADAFAEDLENSEKDLPRQLEAAWHRALQRPPTEVELQSMKTLVRRHGLPQLCRMIFNLNEFAFVD